MKILQRNSSGRRPSNAAKSIPITVYSEVKEKDSLGEFVLLASRWGEVKITNRSGKLYFKYRIVK